MATLAGAHPAHASVSGVVGVAFGAGAGLVGSDHAGSSGDGFAAGPSYVGAGALGIPQVDLEAVIFWYFTMVHDDLGSFCTF